MQGKTRPLLLVAALAAVGTLVSSSATADIKTPPAGQGGADGVCEVQGTVEVGDPAVAEDGVSSTQKDNQYDFDTASITCTSATVPFLNGTFDVDATGETTGSLPPTSNTHDGEDCEQGHHKGAGTITATKQDGVGTGATSGNGQVFFQRVGEAVVAWGTIPFSGHPDVEFLAELQFAPQAHEDPVGACVDDPPTDTIEDADLTGASQVEAV